MIGHRKATPPTPEEEVLILVRAAQAGAFDECFTKAQGWLTYARDANATALAVARSILGRPFPQSTLREAIGTRGSDLVWDEAFRHVERGSL